MARRLSAAKLQAKRDAADELELHVELVRALSVLEPGERHHAAEACFMHPKEAGRYIRKAMGENKTRGHLRSVLLGLPQMLQLERFGNAVLEHNRFWRAFEAALNAEPQL